MYDQDTILALKEPRDPDPETKEPFPYNEVKVIGPSPVSHGHKGEWTGQDAEGVVIVPLTNFGATLDEPFGKLRTMYEVKSLPEPLVPNVPVITRSVNAHSAAAGKTPEEIFAEAEALNPPPADDRRARRKAAESPLGQPGGPKPKKGAL